ncbi:MAG TPA: FtsQ-type POTRA domain-containing protein [Terriglobales bacterium]
MTRERIDLHGQDEFLPSAAAREDISARTIDLEDDEEAQFLRTEKRVPVRRGPLARKTANRVKIAVKLSMVAGLLGSAVAVAYGYGAHAARFLIDSSDDIEISGVRNASRVQVMDIAGADIGRNVFFVPLDERRAQLEKIPWVESATVMRLLPNHIAVDIAERTPVAFVEMGAKINLIDAGGVVLGAPANRQTRYSFPVIHGIAETEPLSSRAAVMKIYNRLISDLDAGGYTRQLSEVDLSDPNDVKATVSDSGGMVVLHLGDADFRDRYKLYAAHIGEWRQQFPKVQSVDLRYEGQIVVNPDTEKSVDRQIHGSGERKTVLAKQPRRSQKKSDRRDRHHHA